MKRMNEIKNIPFSVCMSVYKNDSASFLQQTIDSIITKQTARPTEVVLVKDGPLTVELDTQIDALCHVHPEIRVIALEKNQGLGIALRTAVEAAQYELIARMDSDDIALPDRFEKQLAFMATHPEADIVGGQIEEFITSPDAIVGKRIVPCQNEDIYTYMKRRCAMNHVTVMFRKQSILKAGNYLDWHYNEDYYLWVRMMLQHMHFANIEDTLVYVRVGEQMYKRRGGYTYYKSEKGIQRYMLEHHLINLMQYINNVSIRFVVQVLLPNQIRGKLFQLFFRK